MLPGHERAFLGPLKIGRIPGIGKATQQKLNQWGVTRVGELTAVGRRFLNETFGLWGEALYQKTLGQETAHGEFHEEPKSISQEHTFGHDTHSNEQVQRTLACLVQKAAYRLRDHRLFARTITLKLRGSDFCNTHSSRFPCRTDPVRCRNLGCGRSFAASELERSKQHPSPGSWLECLNLRTASGGPVQEGTAGPPEPALSSCRPGSRQIWIQSDPFGPDALLRGSSERKRPSRPGCRPMESQAVPGFNEGSWHDG